MQEFVITLLVHAVDQRDAESYAEGIADGSGALILRVAEAAPADVQQATARVVD